MKNLSSPPRLVAALAAAVALATQAEAATTFLWNVPAPGANPWNFNANWLPATGNPASADTAVFGAIGAANTPTIVNNVVSVSTAITSLLYTNNLPGTWHVTEIPAGVTLTTSGNVFVGRGLSDTDVTSAAMTGGGTFAATGGAFIIGIQGNAALNHDTILDLSGLSNFVYNASAGLIGMGVSNRSTASLTLAAGSNYVTVGTINLDTGSSSSSGAAGTLRFGAGTNVINVGAINIGANRTAGTATFATSTGGLRLRGVGGGDGDRVTTIVLGNRNTGSSTGGTTTGTLAFNGHPIDAKIATLTMGQETSAANAGLVGVGNVQFDQGTLDVTTINMAILTGNHSNNVATGTMTVGASGTLLVNNVSLANTSLTTNGIAANGTLFVNGGLAICTNNIVKTGTLSVNTGTVAVATGTLWVQGKLGTPANPINNFNLTNATFRIAVDASGDITTNAVVSTVNAGGVTTIDIAQATGVDFPTTFPLIAYGTLNGTVAGNFTLTVPAGYIGSLVDNAAQQRIDLSISPSVIIVPLLWTGATNGDWDTVTTNWTLGGVLATYADDSPVVFDDSASNSTVNLTAPLSPASMVMSNSVLNYAFIGSGSLAGTNSLTLKGSMTTILDNAGSNSFTGGIVVRAGATLQVGNSDANGNLPDGQSVNDNGALVYKRTDDVTNNNAISGAGTLTQSGSGTLTLAGANSYGATTIGSGTLQVGAGSASGSLGSGSVLNNGSLIFNRSDPVTVANLISGSGSVTKNNNNTLTLSGANGYGGGLTADAGTARLANIAAAGTGTVTVNSGGTVVLSALLANSIVLAGGTLGSSANLSPLTNDLTAAASTASTIYYADPQNLAPTDGNEMAWSNTLHGSGSLLLASVTNDVSPDNGNGFRLRGTTASDFSGTITLSNNVKAELQTAVAGPFSPAGSGKFRLVCGAFNGTNNQNGPTIGGYCELNLRNNGPGDTVLGHDVELLGTGTAFLDPLGTAPVGSKVTMGNLKLGSGQELGVYLSAAPSHVIAFQTVTLSGGMAKFSPKTPGFGAVTSAGSDLSLGNITETANSGIITAGLSNLILTGNSPNLYTGPTTNLSGTLTLNKSSGDAIPGYLAISGGTVSLSAANQIADAATVNLSGGALALGSFSDTVGPVILSGGAITGTGGLLVGASYDLQNGSVSAILGGPAALTKSTAGTVSLSAANAYSGNTLVSFGTLALTGSGSISNSPAITVASGATLDASTRTDSTLTLPNTQTLQGDGNIAGNLLETPNAAVLPGGAGAIGALTVSGGATLQGTTHMDLSKSPLTNDVITAASFAYGGTLDLPVLNGALANGDSFQLFRGASYAGSFAAVVPALPYVGGVWDLRPLTNNGTIIAVNQQPPTINCPGDMTVPCAGPGGTPVTYSPTATDTVGNPLPVTCTPPSGTSFPVGRTPVVCQATDGFGNSAACSFTVIVTDNTPVSLSAALQGANLVLSWPDTCSTYFLQSNSTLDGTTPWAPMTAPAIASNGVNTVTVPIDSAAAFFRLIQAPTLAFAQLDLDLDDGFKPDSDWGSVDLTYVGSSNALYFNLSVNGSWQVQNIPLPSVEGPGVPQTLTLNFRLGDDGVQVTNVHYDFSLTPFVSSMPLGSATTGSITAPVSDRLVVLFNNELPGSNVYSPAQPLTGGVATALSDAATNYPNHDVGTNECVPGAVVNGLEHLGITNGITLATMKTATAWGPTGAPIGWWTNKDAYMQSNSLPVGTTATTNVADAVTALSNSSKCVVELGGGGHRACVTRIVDQGGGKYTITVAHETQQGQAGGTKQEDVTYDSTTGTLTGAPGFNNVNFRNFVIECRTD